MEILTREPRAASEITELRRFLLVLSVGLIAVAMGPSSSTLDGAMVTLGCVLLLGSLFAPADYWIEPRILAVVGAVFAFSFLYGVVSELALVGAVSVVLVAVAGAVVVWLFVGARVAESGGKWLLTGLALLVVGVAATAALIQTEQPRIDVILINEAGADALASGENPYVTVVVPDANPFAEEGSRFIGYTYPPAALAAFSGSEWLTGDTRWINVLGIALFVLLVAGPWRNRGDDINRVFLAGALALAFLPQLAFLLTHGWTDPIALPLLAGAALTWSRRPVAAAVMLGLALATKQYFVLLAPLILVWNDEHRWKRTTIVAAVVGITMLPAVIAGPQAFWEAVVAPAFETVPRPDSLNVIALGFEPPSWLASASGLLVAVTLGRRGGGAASFFGASAAVTGVAFLFGSQAFSNYWLLVLGLIVLSYVSDADGEPLPSDKGVGHSVAAGHP